MQAKRKFTLWIIHFSKTSFKREISSPEQTSMAWTNRIPRILKCVPTWLSSSPPCLRTREKFLEGAKARCCAITSSSVSRCWVIVSIIFLVNDFLFLFQMDYTTLNTKVFATHPNITRFLSSTEQESLGKDKVHKQREETRLKSFTGQLSKMATSVCYQNCQLSTFINKISRSAYAPEIYLGFAYQRVSVDSDDLTQANLFSYLRKKPRFSRYFSILKNLNSVISNLCDKQSPQKEKKKKVANSVIVSLTSSFSFAEEIT